MTTMCESTRTRTVGELCTHITSGSRGWAAYYAHSGAAFIRITNLKRESLELDLSNLKFVKLPRLGTEGARTQLRTGDVLMSITADVGAIGFFNGHLDGEAFVNQHVALLRPDPDKIVPKYLAYVLASAPLQKEIRRRNDQGAKVGLNLNAIRTLRVEIPQRPKQERIVEILDAADRAVQLTEAIIEVKLNHKRALAERLLTGRWRFPEFSDQPWRDYRLGDLFSERVETNRPDLKLLSVTNVGVVDRSSLSKRDTSSEEKTRYLRVAPGDIVYNTLRMWQGVSGLSSSEGIVSPDYTVCVPMDQIDGRYASYLFKLPSQVETFRRYSHGLTNDRWRLRFPIFATIRVRIPSRPEQEKIADVFDLMEREIALLRRQFEALKKQKPGLMQKLLSGARCA